MPIWLILKSNTDELSTAAGAPVSRVAPYLLRLANRRCGTAVESAALGHNPHAATIALEPHAAVQVGAKQWDLAQSPSQARVGMAKGIAGARRHDRYRRRYGVEKTLCCRTLGAVVRHLQDRRM